MVVVQYLCAECGTRFSFVEMLNSKQDTRTCACPQCNNRTLILIHKETWDSSRKKKKEGMYYDY